jgi:hypothetical protein
MQDSPTQSASVDPKLLHAGDTVLIFNARKPLPRGGKVRRVDLHMDGSTTIVTTNLGRIPVPAGCEVEAVIRPGDHLSRHPL